MQKILLLFILFYQYQNVVTLYTPIDYMMDKLVDFVIDLADTVIQLKDRLGNLFVVKRMRRPVQPLSALSPTSSTPPCSHYKSRCSKCNKGQNVLGTTSPATTSISTENIKDSNEWSKPPLETARRAAIDELFHKVHGNIMKSNFSDTKVDETKNATQDNVNVTVTLFPMLELGVTDNIVPISASTGNATNNLVSVSLLSVNMTENFIPMHRLAVNVTNHFVSMSKLAERHGRSVELHSVQTKDGYLLTLHRIKTENGTTNENSKAVLMHHGLLGSSADWILLGANNSLPYQLSKSGYDVWLSNARGNYHSRDHVTLKVNSEEFWNFSFHEVGEYDLPATIDYIRKLKKNTPISFVGHSMGASALLVLLSTLPEYNNHLDIGILLAPLAFMANIQGPLKSLSASDFEIVIHALGVNGEFLPSRKVPKFLREKFCKGTSEFCNNPLFFLSGGLLQSNMSNSSFIDCVMKQVPSGGSLKTVLHYSQLLRNRKFHKFDNASLDYPLMNITLPIALISSEDDWLAPTSDVNKLLNNIINLVEHEMIRDKNISHTEFVWGATSNEHINTKIIELLNSPTKSNML